MAGICAAAAEEKPLARATGELAPVSSRSTAEAPPLKALVSAVRAMFRSEGDVRVISILRPEPRWVSFRAADSVDSLPDSARGAFLTVLKLIRFPNHPDLRGVASVIGSLLVVCGSIDVAANDRGSGFLLCVVWDRCGSARCITHPVLAVRPNTASSQAHLFEMPPRMMIAVVLARPIPTGVTSGQTFPPAPPPTV